VFYCIYQLCRENDAKGFGALEHLPLQQLPELIKKELVKSMMDVVSMNFLYRKLIAFILKKSKISIIMT
jgi:hypothetical protein